MESLYLPLEFLSSTQSADGPGSPHPHTGKPKRGPHSGWIGSNCRDHAKSIGALKVILKRRMNDEDSLDTLRCATAPQYTVGIGTDNTVYRLVGSCVIQSYSRRSSIL